MRSADLKTGFLRKKLQVVDSPRMFELAPEKNGPHCRRLAGQQMTVSSVFSKVFKRSSGERTRTSTGILPLDFESSASANSATPPDEFVVELARSQHSIETRFYSIGSSLFKGPGGFLLFRLSWWIHHEEHEVSGGLGLFVNFVPFVV